VRSAQVVMLPAPHVNLAITNQLPKMVLIAAKRAHIIHIVRNAQVMVYLAMNAKTNSTRKKVAVTALHVL